MRAQVLVGPQVCRYCAAMSEPLVVIDKVNKHFGDLHVLKDIDLSIDKGEVVILIGPSGSGKSTLCRTINRLETFESGSITIDGKTLPDEGKELADLRADVGMVFQSFNLFAHKTILENVTLAARKPLEEMPKLAAASAKVKDALGSEGRVLIRWSGTEAKLRIMIEGPSEDKIRNYALSLVAAAKKDVPG